MFIIVVMASLIHMSKLTQGYTLSMSHSLYFSPNFIKLFLTDVEFDPTMCRDVFLEVYLSRRANWRAAGVGEHAGLQHEALAATGTPAPQVTADRKGPLRVLPHLGNDAVGPARPRASETLVRVTWALIRMQILIPGPASSKLLAGLLVLSESQGLEDIVCSEFFLIQADAMSSVSLQISNASISQYLRCFSLVGQRQFQEATVTMAGEHHGAKNR